jgi:hypothetical protein
MPGKNRPRIYEGEGDRLMEGRHDQSVDRIILVPDTLPSREPDPTRRCRIMWGQHLLEDLLAGRYRSLVCAVNAEDNSHGIITQLASLLPTSQWDEESITAHARRFAAAGGPVKVIKYDMDSVEVLAVLRPADRQSLTLMDLAAAFRIVTEMLRTRTDRLPSASVSFLGGRSNRLIGKGQAEPSFESVLQVMYEAGYAGDVYPAPAMWEAAPTGVFARFPFPSSLDRMRNGGS